LRVSFLDVGQGDSSIVELAVGRRLLVIDGGARTGSFDAGERVLLPALRAKGARHVSAAVLSHPDQDHYGGLRVLTRQMVTSEIWRTGSETPSQDFGDLLLDFSQRQVRTRLLRRGAVPITAGPDGELRILHPPLGSAKEMSKNDGSLVALLRYGALALLFTGDIEARGESALLGSGLDAGAAVLKAPHHGSRTSSSRALVRAVRPSLVVAMLGAGNPFGFPAREVVDR
jgi:competence protein ComEC